jgi:hypothetical protein
MKRLTCLSTLSCLLMIFFAVIDVFALDRRRDQFGNDFSYYIYPIASTIPGLGTATGAGFSVLNMAESDVDFTGFYLRGDFDASGFVLLDLHLLPETLVFDIGRYDYRVATKAYERGMESAEDEFIFVEAEGDSLIGQMTLSLYERMFELYYRYGAGKNRLISLLDKEGEKFENTDTDWSEGRQTSYGFIFDWTDDRLDPREGLRMESVRKTPENNNDLSSKYHINESNLSVYIPVGKINTLVLNAYKSDAVVYDKATTDRVEIQNSLGIYCDPNADSFQQCSDTMEKAIDRVVADNEYGTASSLGGTQRLRSYPGGRFYAGHALFWGAEFRWNLNDVKEPFDFLIAKGVHTGFQLAAFAEQGAAADDPGELTDNMKSSYGVGFRTLMSGVVIRLDWATGEEGAQTQLFINYSWGLFSVDSPG